MYQKPHARDLLILTEKSIGLKGIGGGGVGCRPTQTFKAAIDAVLFYRLELSLSQLKNENSPI